MRTKLRVWSIFIHFIHTGFILILSHFEKLRNYIHWKELHVKFNDLTGVCDLFSNINYWIKNLIKINLIEIMSLFDFVKLKCSNVRFFLVLEIYLHVFLNNVFYFLTFSIIHSLGWNVLFYLIIKNTLLGIILISNLFQKY